MLSMTSSAADVVSTIRENNGIPAEFGLRLFPQESPEGSAVQITFAPEPAADDQVTESEGHRLFVASDLVEPLDDVVLDARQTPDGTGLYLRGPETA